MKNLHFIPVLQAASAEAVEALAREIWPDHYTPLIGGAQVAYMLEKFQSKGAVLAQIKEGQLYFLIQNPEKNVIGYLALQPRERELFLSKLYLRAEKRGKGFGRRVLAWIASFARERELPKITLTVHKRNPSVEIYQKLGFRITGPLVTEIGKGFVMDDFQMEWTPSDYPLPPPSP